MGWGSQVRRGRWRRHRAEALGSAPRTEPGHLWEKEEEEEEREEEEGDEEGEETGPAQAERRPGWEPRAAGTRTRAPHLGCCWISGAFHRDTAAYASLSPGEARESSWISLCGALPLLGKGTGPGAAGTQRRGAGSPPRPQTSRPIAAAGDRGRMRRGDEEGGEGGLGARRHFSGLLRRGRAGCAGKGVGLAGRTSSPRNASGRLPALPPAGTAPAGTPPFPSSSSLPKSLGIPPGNGGRPPAPPAAGTRREPPGWARAAPGRGSPLGAGHGTRTVAQDTPLGFGHH